MKKCFEICGTYKNEPSEDVKKEIKLSINQAFSKIDKAVKRGVFHQNTGANQKSRLSSAVKTAIEPNVNK